MYSDLSIVTLITHAAARPRCNEQRVSRSLDLACATQVRFLPSVRASASAVASQCWRERRKGVEFPRETWRNTQSFTASLLHLCQPIEIIPSRLGERTKAIRSTFTINMNQERWMRPIGHITYAEASKHRCCPYAIYTRPPHLNGINLHAPWLNELDRVSASCKPAGWKRSW